MNLTDLLCLDNIKACCAAAQLAYSQSTITDPISGESVLIQDCGNCTIIAFPGTHDLRDVLRDIDCLRIVTMILGQPCSIHAGFNRTHNALIEKIILACSPKGTAATSTTEVLSASQSGSLGRKRLSFFGNLVESEPSEAVTPILDFSTSLASSTETKNCQRDCLSPSPLNGERVGVRGENTQVPSATPIFLTGHSKGAAVARRCALTLVEKNFPVAGLITFGEPRGGDARYAAICDRALASRSLRITNAADPVPWMPAWLAGNRHCGPEGWLAPGKIHDETRSAAVLGRSDVQSFVNVAAPEDGRIPVSSGLILGPQLWYQLLLDSTEILRAWQLKDLAPLADHHIDNYLRRIDAL